MLIIAIVVMTVVLLLGLAITRVLSTSSSSVVYEVLGFRALNAARSGLESNLTSILNAPLVDGNVPSPRALCESQGVVNSGVNFASIPGFENCRYVTQCGVQGFNNDQDEYFRFTSTGFCTIDNVSEVSRTVSVDARI